MFDLCFVVLLRVKKASNTGFDLLLLLLVESEFFGNWRVRAHRLLRLVCGNGLLDCNKKNNKNYYAVPSCFFLNLRFTSLFCA